MGAVDVNGAKVAARTRDDAVDSPPPAGADMQPLFETIISYVPAPAVR
mgnify:CR=1 FL=1